MNKATRDRERKRGMEVHGIQMCLRKNAEDACEMARHRQNKHVYAIR